MLVTLVRTALAYGRAHWLRTLLLISGIAFGVSGVVAIDIAKTSVSRSFDLSTGLIAGRATHTVMGMKGSIPQSLFTRIRVSLGIRGSAPIIRTQAVVREFQDRTFTLLGVDPFSETGFRHFAMDAGQDRRQQSLADQLFTSSGVLISTDLAEENGLSVNDHLTLAFGQRSIAVRIAGLLDGDTPWEKAAYSGILLSDISVMQELLDMGDTITGIDLILENSAMEQAVRNLLPPHAILVKTRQWADSLRHLSSSFEASLTAFSFLALFMGMFLIYNTVSFSVAQRQTFLATLRSLGVRKSELAAMIVLEVLVYSLIGSIAGILMGMAFAVVTVQAVCSTVSSMYAVLTVNQTFIPLPVIAKGLFSGILSACFAALVPALTAGMTPPVSLSQRSGAEVRLTRFLPHLSIAGVMIVSIALGILLLPKSNPMIDFIGIFMIFTGTSLLIPLLTTISARVLAVAWRNRPGSPVTMALNSIVRSLSRTGLLIASLMVVASVYIGVGTMTASFRQSVSAWVDGNIGGDIHIMSADRLHPEIPGQVTALIKALPGIKTVSEYSIHRVLSPEGLEVTVFSYASDVSRRDWTWTVGNDEMTRLSFDRGWIYVSELFARQNGILPGPGATVTLLTVTGPFQFHVAGIFRDYYMGGGRIIVSREAMRTHWGITATTAMQLFIDSPDHVRSTLAAIESLPQGDGTVLVREGKTLKQKILRIFDQTFAITSALQILTAIVALTGIINTIMALLLERRHETGVLRACGAESSQVTRLLLLESGLCGLIAGVAALPFGLFLSWILVNIINKNAFGWTYALQVQPGILVLAVAMPVLAALAAGYLPAVSAGKFPIIKALRTE